MAHPSPSSGPGPARRRKVVFVGKKRAGDRDPRDGAAGAGAEAPRAERAAASPDVRWDARLWGTLIVLCGVLFLDGLDVSMVGVALPSISEDLDLTTSQLQWIVSGYVLGYGGLLLLGGRVADLLGRRRVLLAGLSVFTLASLVGGLVDDASLLVATRFVKGMAAAFTAPAALSIVTTTFAEGPSRNKALSIYTAFGASGFSSGLVLGGLMTEVGWRWTFLLPVPFAALILATAPRLIRKDAPRVGPRKRFDIPGALAATAGMLVLVRAVVQAPETGWGAPETVGSFVLAAALLALFVTIEQRTAEPLVRLGLLRSGHITRANLAAMATAGCYFGFQFVAMLFLQQELGWSPIETALAFLPAGLIVAFGSTRVGGLVDRFGTGKVIAVAFAAFAAGYALFLPIDTSPTYTVAILPTMLLIGAGFALGFPSTNMQATMGVGDSEQGIASGLVQTSFQVGGATVLAVVSAIVTSQGSVVDALQPALAVVTGVAALGLAVALGGVLGDRREPALATEG
ncbi:MAG: MFS transporter [Solirubrobacterales bacterium]|nr:MFS transporter [Solirubrobacterales bacterium]